MKVEDLILQLQDVISAAKSMPFSGGKVMVSSDENELVREAQAQAKEIVDDAKQKSAEIRKAANVYVDSIMKRTEEGVATQLEALRKTHANIVSSQKKQG